MSIPRDGYYIAVVQDGTGGEAATHVQVKNGTPLTRRGGALKPEACSQFMEVSVPQFCRVWYSDAAVELEALRKANAGLVEKVAETQSELDKSARILLETVNDRNRIGTQLDLIRDELMRIRARIAETGLIREHPELSSIAGYCERAQADIAVLYTPIQECERVSRELTACRNGRAELVDENALLMDRVKRLEEAGDAMRKKSTPMIPAYIEGEDGEEMPIRDADPEARISWLEDPPTVGEVVAFLDAIDEWNKAKSQP